MEENQDYLLTQQHVNTLISDEKLMMVISNKHLPDFFPSPVMCLVLRQPLSAPFTRQGKQDK